MNGYSAKIELQLLVHGKRLRLGQLGANTIGLREPLDITCETPAKIVIAIDGRISVERVILERVVRRPSKTNRLEIAYRKAVLEGVS